MAAPLYMFMLPLAPVEFFTCHLPYTCSRPSQDSKDLPPKSMLGLALYFFDSGMPFSSAAADVNALKVEPAW